MKCYDFEYDDLNLSDFGMIICKFGSNGTETISNGSNITFNTIPTMNGQKHELTSVEYGDCLTTTFQICKHPCNSDYDEISIDEVETITTWLNRKKFHKFKLLNADYLNIFFEASFNVSKIEINGLVYGLELEVITNRPFALRESISTVIKNIRENGEKRISSLSDEEGYIYPEMTITIQEDGDLEIYNEFENRTMRIANCKSGEVIKLSYPMIETSLSTHKIQNDFNWIFFRIARTFREKVNNLTISIPCTIEIKYCPIVKVGI